MPPTDDVSAMVHVEKVSKQIMTHEGVPHARKHVQKMGTGCADAIATEGSQPALTRFVRVHRDICCNRRP